MVKVSDCGCCDCDSKQEREQIKERALSSINKVWTSSGATYYPDGTGMVTLPLPTSAQIAQMEENTELIKANTADITALDKKVDETEGTVGKIPTGYTLYRNGEGKVMLQAEAKDGSLINSNTLDMIIPYQYDLISGTTERSFKLQITMSDGSQYTTNDFVIPEGGGTDVSVTGIVLSKDQGDVNRFHVGINLSDGTMIDSGYISMVDSVGATVADGKLTITVNGVSSVPVEVGASYTAGDGIKIESGTIAISDELAERLTTMESDITNVVTIANRAFDTVSISGSELTLERGNGGTETVTLPSGGEEWEEVDLDNWPVDWVDNTTIKIVFKIFNVSTSAANWDTKPTKITVSTYDYPNNTIQLSLKASNTSPHIPIYEIMDSNFASVIDIYTLHAYSNFNLGYIFMLHPVTFNGGGMVDMTIEVKPDNIKTYVYKMYRKLPN